MKAIFRNAAIIAAAALMMTSAAACSDQKNESSSGNNMVGNVPSDSLVMDEENMPYGATMVSLKKKNNDKVKIDIDFDPRYFVQEGESDYPEIYLLTEYIEAMQNKDGATIDKLFYKPYHDYSMSNTNYEDTQDYIEKFMDMLMTRARSNIEFTYSVVDTCLNENESENLTDFEFVDSKLDELTGEKITDKIKSRKLVYMDISYKDDSGNYYQINDSLGHDLSVYIYNIDGTYYLL